MSVLPRLVRVAVMWTVVVSLGLLGYAIATGIRVGAVIVVIPLAAAGLASVAPRSVAGLVAADILLVTAAVLLLIGWVGLLYLPPLMLVIAAAGAARMHPSNR